MSTDEEDHKRKELLITCCGEGGGSGHGGWGKADTVCLKGNLDRKNTFSLKQKKIEHITISWFEKP
jgi:hypothetical protein